MGTESLGRIQKEAEHFFIRHHKDQQSVRLCIQHPKLYLDLFVSADARGFMCITDQIQFDVECQNMSKDIGKQLVSWVYWAFTGQDDNLEIPGPIKQEIDDLVAKKGRDNGNLH